LSKTFLDLSNPAVDVIMEDWAEKIYPKILIHLAAHLRTSVTELDVEVTAPIALPNGCYTCQRSPEAAFLRRPSVINCSGLTKSILTL